LIARVWSEVKARVGSMPLAQQFARRDGLGHALVGQVDIPPAGEAVFQVPLALAVADEDQLGHGGSL
jgi:hypothetical protein